MCYEEAFDLGGPDAFARDLKRIVAAAEDEPVAVFVTHREIPVHPDVFESAPIGVEITFFLLPKTACHADPRLLDDELAHLAGADGFAVFVEDVDVHSGTRSGKRAGLDRQQRITH